MHLWPGADPAAPGVFGAVDAFGDGLAAVAEAVADDVPDRAGGEEVEALAMFSPSARVAPSGSARAEKYRAGLGQVGLANWRWRVTRSVPGPPQPGASTLEGRTV